MKSVGGKSIEFEGVVAADGMLRIPASVLHALDAVPGTKLHVRLTGRSLAEELRKRGISEEEIAAIAGRQMEPREQVLRFLFAEGRLRALRGFRKRDGR